MSALLARIRKIEAARGGQDAVSDADMAEAKRLTKRWAHFMIRETFAKDGMRWPPTGEPLPWPPTAEELAEIEEIKARDAWVSDVFRRDWEAQNPGKSYEAHRAERRAEAERLIEAAFGGHARAPVAAIQAPQAANETLIEAKQEARDQAEPAAPAEPLRLVPRVPLALQ